MKYKLIRSNHQQDFEFRINEALRLGWMFSGNLVINESEETTTFSQGLIYPEIEA